MGSHSGTAGISLDRDVVKMGKTALSRELHSSDYSVLGESF